MNYNIRNRVEEKPKATRHPQATFDQSEAIKVENCHVRVVFNQLRVKQTVGSSILRSKA
jgi:hypothetical protein